MKRVHYASEVVGKPKLPYRKVSTWLDQVVLPYQKQVDQITYIFCSDEYLKEINQRYLNHDYYTDIVTFDYTHEQLLAGDLYISLDRVKDNARQFGVTFQNELLRVMVHGLFHLIGFTDRTEPEKKAMRKLEDDALILYVNL